MSEASLGRRAGQLALVILLGGAAVFAVDAVRPWVDDLALRLVGPRAEGGAMWHVRYNAAWIGLSLSAMGLAGVLATLLLVGPRRLPETMSLGPGRGWLRYAPLLALSATFPVYLGNHLRALLFGPASEHLVSFHGMIADAEGTALVALVFAISLVPAVAEELLFRGFLFGGLRRVVPIGVAIALVSLAFAAAHPDMQHRVGIFFAGLWMTLVAWRAGSMWAAVLVHFAGNLTTALLGSAGLANADHIAWPLHVLAWLVTFPCLVALMPWMLGRRGAEPT